MIEDDDDNDVFERGSVDGFCTGGRATTWKASQSNELTFLFSLHGFGVASFPNKNQDSSCLWAGHLLTKFSKFILFLYSCHQKYTEQFHYYFFQKRIPSVVLTTFYLVIFPDVFLTSKIHIKLTKSQSTQRITF